MTTNGFPPIEAFFDQLYGAEGVDNCGLTCLYFGNASGIVFTGNPPYYIQDFLKIYPKFLGPPTNYSGLSIVAGSSTITGFTDISGLTVGQLVSNINSIPPDAIIHTVDTTLKHITISTVPTQNDTSLTVFQTPYTPIVVILSYLNLALASVMQARYHEAWEPAMAYFIAHYCTLWMRSDGGSPNYTIQSAAISGLSTGIMTSQAAGDVSMGMKPLDGYDEFGAWRETSYGELFMTLAKTIGSGAIWVR